MFTLKRPCTNTPLLIIITLFIFITACQSNPTKPNTTTEEYWEYYLYPNSYRTFITNGIVAYNMLQCTVHEGILQFNDFDNLPFDKPAIALSVDFTYKPVMSNDITAYIPSYDKRGVLFTHNNIPYSNTGFASISTWQFGERYDNYEFWIANFQRPFGAINEQNRFIGVIRGYEPAYHTYSSYLVYVDLAVEHDNLVVTDYGLYNIPMMVNGDTHSYTFTWYNDKIYLSFVRAYNGDDSYELGSYYVEISSNGAVRTIPIHPYIQIASLFVYQNHLFSHIYGDGLVAYSTDGEQWTPFGYMRPYLLDAREIDNSLFFYVTENLYCTSDDLVNRAIYQLPTGNIQGRFITSINKFQNYLVITTNYGIFYKLYDDVMRDKVMVASSEEGDIRFLGE